MTVNQEVKGTLARLLATENLTVEHRRVTTAYFDVEKRLLCLPIWNTASETVYDLLVGHEVGHALYTPQEGLEDAPKAFVNVLEDARIERMMKVTYPGLRKTFFDGYKELWDRDFFSVANEDLTKIPLIDRINLYFKGNSTIEFTDAEQIFVSRASKTKTFQDVLDLANDLYDYAQQAQETKEQIADAPDSPDLVDEDGDISVDKEEELEIDPVSKEETDESQDNKGELSDSELLDQLNYGGEGLQDFKPEPKDYDETESLTDSAFKEALETLIDDSAKEWVYLDLPKIDVKKVVTPAAQVQEDLRFHFYGLAVSSKEELQQHEESLEYAIQHYQKFKKDTQKTVNYLVKQFEMKKAADQYKRAATSKTGVIDTNKLHQYKLTEDIFKKITTVSDGKNHGLVMFLDWSGSMNQVLLDTLKQTYNLIWFCKKSNIPFRVLAFQNGYYSRSESYSHECVKNPKENQLHIGSDFRLIEFFSSRQNPRSLEESLKLVYAQAFAMNSWRMRIHQGYNLGGTPLAEAIYCARDIVNDLKRTDKVQKVNVVCLTDGESNPIQWLQERSSDYYGDGLLPRQLCHSGGRVFFIRDPETGVTKKISTSPYVTTKEIVSFFRGITNYNWIGIRLCSKSEANRVFRYFADENYSILDKQWKKERFASIKEKCGFSEAFFMPDQGIGEGTANLEVKQKGEEATRAELTRAFKKHMGSKMSNKTILNKFIEQIA
tara:strand:+ start:2792 stop:4951 length:2160 start_codon:yes stop_codon:yes gene_type:complete